MFEFDIKPYPGRPGRYLLESGESQVRGLDGRKGLTLPEAKQLKRDLESRGCCGSYDSDSGCCPFPDPKTMNKLKHFI